MNISYSSLLKIALPLALGAFVQFLVVLTDNLFLTRVSESAINGAGNGGMMYITAVMLAIGLSSGLQILIARRNGEGNLDEVGSIFGSGMRIAMVLSVALYIIFLLLDRFFFDSIIQSPEILKVMREFLQIRSLGLFVYIPVLMFNSIYIGLAETKVVSYAMIITALLNILFDWLLIFGVGPFPEMQHQGAAFATFIAEIAGLLFILYYTVKRFDHKKYNLWTGLTQRTQGLASRIFKISVPLMVQQVLALATWTTFYFFVEKVGSAELKVSHIVRNSYMLAFVIAMGVNYTTRTVISSLIAEKRQAELGLAMKRLIIINIVGAIILCHGLLLYPEWIALQFYDAGDPGVAMLVRTFRVVFFAILLFTCVSIFLNAVEGSGRTKAGMVIEMISITVYLFVVYQITLVSPQPIHIIWMSDYLYFALMGVFSLLYLWRADWKHHQI
ncbi:MAG: MATE family efflux transporter [Flavobacteriales bacterium]|nr:MATE family efflux transporter [Flavobacteriales bacterium]